AKHMHASPASLRGRGAAITQQVEDVIMRALAKEPAQRFASIQQFAEALQNSSQVPQSNSMYSPQSNSMYSPTPDDAGSIFIAPSDGTSGFTRPPPPPSDPRATPRLTRPVEPSVPNISSSPVATPPSQSVSTRPPLAPTVYPNAPYPTQPAL